MKAVSVWIVMAMGGQSQAERRILRLDFLLLRLVEMSWSAGKQAEKMHFAVVPDFHGWEAGVFHSESSFFWGREIRMREMVTYQNERDNCERGSQYWRYLWSHEEAFSDFTWINFFTFLSNHIFLLRSGSPTEWTFTFILGEENWSGSLIILAFFTSNVQ